MKELIEISSALKRLLGRPCALATVIRVEGSAYRQPGARMLMTPEGEVWGMVSGGCLEHDVLDHGRRALQSNRARIVRYDSTSEDDPVFGTGLGCNGVIDVLIEPIADNFRKSFVLAVDHCVNTRQRGMLVTHMHDSDGFVRCEHLFFTNGLWSEDAEASTPVNGSRYNGHEMAQVQHNPQRPAIQTFIQPLTPPLQIVAFGGWFDLLPLIHLAHEVGARIIVVDASGRQSSRRLYGEADEVLLCEPNDAVSQISFDNRTAAVLMNHHVERDQQALLALIDMSLPFLGMLGPKRRRQRILDNLREQGIDVPSGFEGQIHSPVGLDLGAETPAEIALSILAEILAVMNQRDGQPVRDRLSPLHSVPSLPAYV